MLPVLFKPATLRKLNLAAAIFRESLENFDSIELVISIKQEDVNVKELSSYLDLIYRFDGLMSEVGYESYVRTPRLQIEIDEVRLGSWEVVFIRDIQSYGADKIFIVCVALKFLTHISHHILDLIAKRYDVLIKREDLLEKRERRHFRNHLRELVNNEEMLLLLDKKKKEKLVNLLDELYLRNVKRVIPSSRFASKSIKKLEIKPHNRKRK